MSSPSFKPARLSVTGEADPQLPARVLGIVTSLNHLPLSFSCRLLTSGMCQIEMQLENSDEAYLRRIVTQACKIPSVIEAFYADLVAEHGTSEAADRQLRAHNRLAC